MVGETSSGTTKISADRLALVSKSTARRYQIEEQARTTLQLVPEETKVLEIERTLSSLTIDDKVDAKSVEGIPETRRTGSEKPTLACNRALLNDLAHLRIALLHNAIFFSLSGQRLRFINDPCSLGSYERYVVGSPQGSNGGRCALDPRNSANRQFLAYQSWLLVSYESRPPLQSDVSEDIRMSWTKLSTQLMNELDRLEDLKEIEWKAQQNRSRRLLSDGEDFGDVDTERFFAFQSRKWNQALAPIYAQSLIAASMNVFYRLPGRATRVLLAGMRDTFRLTLEYARGSERLTLEDQRLLRFLARDPRTVLTTFDLDPSVHEYICCPSCFALYPNTPDSPSRCTYRSTKTSQPCKAKLWRRRTIRGKPMDFPVRKYLHQSMKHWLGRMLSREEIKIWLQLSRAGPPNDPMQDIFDGLALRHFTAPGEKTPFLDGPPDELRLIFSLSVDGFNPYQMKEAKQSVSSTAIYMVCLNLPPHLRYLPENMYLVGVIPGPTKPSIEQINHFIALLVDELLIFWNPGVHYSRTALRAFGRHARAAMIPLVCDLIAARQVAGLGPHNHSHMLCSCCKIAQHDIEDFRTAQPRDLNAHIAAATTWRDAESTYRREELFRKTGIRWSELLRLGYWNPILYVVIDSMHNLYLGLIQRHVRDFWGISVDLDDGDASGRDSTKTPPRPSPKVMDAAVDCLLHSSDTDLSGCGKPALYHLCMDRNLRRAGTVRMLLRHLKSWCTKEGLLRPKPSGSHGAVATQSDMHANQGTSITPQRNEELRPHTTDKVKMARSMLTLATATPSAASPEPFETTQAPSNLHIDSDTATSFVFVNSVVAPGQSAARPLKLKGTGGDILAKASTPKSLIRKGLSVLAEMCRCRNISPEGTRAVLAARLWAWKEERLKEGNSLEPELAVAREVRKADPDGGVENSDAYDVPMPGAFPTAPAQIILAPATAQKSMPRNAAIGANNLNVGPKEQVAMSATSRLPPTAAIGKNTLEEYVKDRSRMQLPSWVNPSPLAFGTTQHGKLSADQWRTLAVVNLPITLIRTWGFESGRRYEMLKNFLHLVEAVGMLGYWEADTHSLSRADMLLRMYLEGVKDLYKGGKIQPNHHLALHLTMFVALFGPVHAWRSFAFERFNFMLQSLNFNQNFGELEMTFMMQSCRTANLRPILRMESVTNAMPAFKAAYEKLSGEDRRGIRLDDALRSTPSVAQVVDGTRMRKSIVLNDEVYKALRSRLKLDGEDYKGDGSSREFSRTNKGLLPRTAMQCMSISISGVLYRSQMRSQGDSNIVFQYPSSLEAPGRIEQMFIHQRPTTSGMVERICLVVRKLEPLTEEDRALDPYQAFPDVGGSLYYDEFDAEVMVIWPTDIICHFAKTSMKGVAFTSDDAAAGGSNGVARIMKPCVHVLKLGRLLRASTPIPAPVGSGGSAVDGLGDQADDVPIVLL